MEQSAGWPQRGGPLSRPEGLAVLGLVVGAAALRSVSWMQTAVLFNDGPLFLHMARSFAAGDLASALAHPYHPLYPALVALVQPLLGGWEGAAVFVSVVGGALAVGALFAFLRASFGPREALIGAFLLAVHPWTIQFSADVQSEGLYLAFFLAALACLWQALARASWVGALGAGLFTGLAYLTRPEGLILALVGVAVGMGAVVWRRLPPLRAAGLAAVAAGALVASAAPYVLLLHEQTDEWLLTRKKVVSQILGVEAYRGPVQTRATSYDEPRLAVLDPPAGSESPVAPGSSGTRSLVAAVVTVLDTGQSVLRPDMLLLLLVGLWGARGRPGLRGAL
ncbi:MAG: glycosyltransferase family 39 protein, partial [Myxococcota bacterium]